MQLQTDSHADVSEKETEAPNVSGKQQCSHAAKRRTITILKTDKLTENIGDILFIKHQRSDRQRRRILRLINDLYYESSIFQALDNQPSSHRTMILIESMSGE